MSSERFTHPGLNLGSAHGEDHAAAQPVIFGFWVFMMSDLIIFGLMFATYATMTNHTGFAGGPEPKDVFQLSSIFYETAALLTSTFTFGMAVMALKYGDGVGKLSLWLIVTLALGATFVGLELNDFVTMFEQGAVPQRSGWLSSFFGLVPLHGLHVTTGCIWIVVMLIQLQIYGTSQRVKTRILRLALFWHFLDIIWIGIFSVVYLGGLA